MNKKTGKLILMAGVVALGVVLFWQQQTISRLQRERAELLEQTAKLSASLDEMANAPGQIDSNELARLRGEQSELMRLRNEVAQLRRQTRQPAETSLPPTEAVETARPDTGFKPVIETFAASNHVTLAWKQTLVTGGWSTEPGKRTLLFIQPEPKTPEGGGQAQVLITGRIVEVPEGQLAKLGLGSLNTDIKQGNLQAVYSAEQYRELLNVLEQTEGVKIVSSPRIQTGDGTQANIHIGSTLELPSGETCPIGISMGVSPTLTPDGSSVVMSISSEIRKPSSGGSGR